MKTIRFELKGMLMGLEFAEGANIDVEAENLLLNNLSIVKEVTDAKIVNKEFVTDVLETAVEDGTIEGYVERHIGYAFTLEKDIAKSLTNKQIIDLLFNMDLALEKELCEKVDAINAEPEKEELEELIEFGYQYSVVE